MGYALRIVNRGMDNIELVDFDSPHDGSPTDGTNARWPSYTGWADYTRATNTEEVWKDILRKHPGKRTLTKAHIAAIRAVDISSLEEYNQNRHKWLLYWLDKFDHPVVYNS